MFAHYHSIAHTHTRTPGDILYIVHSYSIINLSPGVRRIPHPCGGTPVIAWSITPNILRYHTGPWAPFNHNTHQHGGKYAPSQQQWAERPRHDDEDDDGEDDDDFLTLVTGNLPEI